MSRSGITYEDLVFKEQQDKTGKMTTRARMLRLKSLGQGVASPEARTNKDESLEKLRKIVTDFNAKEV